MMVKMALMPRVSVSVLRPAFSLSSPTLQSLRHAHVPVRTRTVTPTLARFQPPHNKAPTPCRVTQPHLYTHELPPALKASAELLYKHTLPVLDTRVSRALRHTLSRDPATDVAFFTRHAMGASNMEALFAEVVQDEENYVYTMEWPGRPWVKVGRTNNPQRRLREHRYVRMCVGMADIIPQVQPPPNTHKALLPWCTSTRLLAHPSIQKQ